ncbi:U-box domain-containing protein 35 [Rhodamnia argentea]|uniref:U-box domain-containing protein 35 n=1 Tax=Rhodamnia argentea TaxID=178133 RepID=A0A8B8MRI6_9MYRT|nr:U-box domain-containing protein 35 [Rhodamnia argentea]
MSARVVAEAAHLQDGSQEAAEADGGHGRHHQYDQYSHMLNYYCRSGAGGTSEIEEEEHSSELFEIGSGRTAAVGEDTAEGMSLFSFDIHNGCGGDSSSSAWEGGGGECVYVAVGAKSETSMGALTWTLKNAVADRAHTTVFLVHVFPETRFIPSPLGNLPISGVSEEQAETFKEQERGKRSQLLQKYLNTCISSKVKVDTILIESDMVAKAILELIPVLNMTKLVVGTAKSNSRRLKLRKGNGIADQILQKAPETCEVKVICEGKEAILEQTAMESQSPPSHSKPPTPSRGNPDLPKPMQEGNQRADYFSCMCFKRKAA